MTVPDPGRPDPRQTQTLHAELDSVRRRLAELTPTGPPTAGTGTLLLGAAGLTAALVSVLVAAAVAATTDSSATQLTAIIIAVVLGVGFGSLGVTRLRAWLGRSAALQQQRADLLARHDHLLAALGQQPSIARYATDSTPDITWPTGPAKFRMVIGGIITALIILSVMTTIVVRGF